MEPLMGLLKYTTDQKQRLIELIPLRMMMADEMAIACIRTVTSYISSLNVIRITMV